MSRTGYTRCAGTPARLALAMGLALAGAVGSARAQDGPTTPPVTSTPLPAPSAPGTAVIVDNPPTRLSAGAPAAPSLPADVQVIRFQGPEGMTVEVVGPAPEAVPQGDGKGLATVGLKVGVGYKLRLANLPDRPGVELFPTIEIVGHLHRPAEIDPAKFPIRVVFGPEDITDAADRGRLVTQVVYLEDPEQALPLKLGKDEPASVTLGPAEEPLKVGAALGRVMAIVRIGGRRPTPGELTGPLGDGIARGGCPFSTVVGDRCALPCGPVVGTPPPAGRPWLPRDEYLCDGGDRATPLHFSGDGGLAGIDPRDAVVSFQDDRRARILPTNTVCLYAPRFASVRTSLGANESLNVQEVRAAERHEKEASAAMKQGPKRFAQTASAETGRHRARASGLAGRIYAGEHSEIRVLSGYNSLTHIKGHVLLQGPEKMKVRLKAAGSRGQIGPVPLRRPESAVMTGIIEGAGQTVMTWPARETVGVEVPPNKPGLSVIKQVDVDQAEPGDVVTYTIRFKNIGNTPIKAVSIVDSLMPRLEYEAKSAVGPADTVFTAGENRAGSLELRWELPGALAPGVEGYVSFRAVVR
jgi:uncharacterized repeat protein (TIGR01451 family)